jgi:hypothetical protein
VRGRAEREAFEDVYQNGHRPILDIETVCAGVVQPEPVWWLWERRIPQGKLTIFDGDPDQGKSVVTMDIAARVSTGRGFPDGSECDVSNVIICNVEDGIADTIVPRLMAHGADLERIQIVQGVPDGRGGPRLIDIPDDIAALERLVEKHGAALLIIDPVLTVLSGNSDKDQDARKALAPLRDMAERTGCAVIAVRHLNKSVGLKAIQRGGGNMGLIGVARAGAFFAKDPEDDARRVMAQHKSNLAEKPPSLLYRITSALDGSARIEWLGNSEYDADGLAASSTHDKSELDEAREFLRDELSDGPMWAKQVKQDARDAGISDATLRRAKTALRIKSEKIGVEGWQWALPEKPRREDAHEHVHPTHHEHLEHLEHHEHLPINKPNTAGNTNNDVEDAQHAHDGQPPLGDDLPSEGAQATSGNKRRLTPEETEEVKRLIADGMKADLAREAVLRGRR